MLATILHLIILCQTKHFKDYPAIQTCQVQTKACIDSSGFSKDSVDVSERTSLFTMCKNK